nr:hypothetical protein [Sphingobium sp. AP50]
MEAPASPSTASARSGPTRTCRQSIGAAVATRSAARKEGKDT